MTFARLRRDWYLRHLAASTAPILLGPWRSELGFESLYWQPWLAKWREQYKIDPDRLIPITRGGTGIWYQTTRRVELYDHLTVPALRQSLIADFQRKQSVKQTRLEPWEATLLPFLADQLGLRRYHVLHPSLMYEAIQPWVGGQMSMQQILTMLRFPPLLVPPVPLTLALPEKFVAVKFYARPTFPHSEQTMDWVLQQIADLTKRVPVVLLESGMDADDHMDFPIPLSDRVFSTKSACTPQNNLAVQSAVLAKAQAFVGTYGGSQQLALRLGKPSVGYFTNFEGTSYQHKALVEYLGVATGVPTYIGRPEDAAFLKQVA